MHSNHWNSHLRLRALLLALALLLAPLSLAATPALAAPSCTTSGQTVTCTFSYTGTPETWTVPDGVTEATFDLYGSQNGLVGGSGPTMGGGGRVIATLAVTPTTTYQILVGGTNGFNGGGAAGSTGLWGGANGGGASDVRTGAFTLDDRLLVAGGGGGAILGFTSQYGGGGGYPSGGTGGANGSAQGGGGGSQTEGGAGGPGAEAGTKGQGGKGGDGAKFAGGGGGGGYYGGGGGSGGDTSSGAGGGGSSYATPAATNVSFENGVRKFHGLVIISYDLPDTSAPVITPSVSGTLGNDGWYTSDVTVSWSVTDAESAMSGQSGCDSASITSDTAGETLTCTATSAGGTASQSVTIKRDATNPSVSYTGNAGTYTIDQSVSIPCTAADNLSGIASTTCANITGPAYSFALGTNTRSASATDKAGNTGSGSTTFTVDVTFDSLCTLSANFSTDPAVDKGLCDKLAAAKSAAAAGDSTTKNNNLNAYRRQVTAQSGKALTKQQATTLNNLSKAL